MMRVADLLEGSTMFRGLEMNVAQSNRLLGVIDEMQALTWILVTSEPAQRGAMTGVDVLGYGYASTRVDAYGTPHAAAYTHFMPVSLGHASPTAMYAYTPSNYDGGSTSRQQQSSAVYLTAGSSRY